MRVYRPARSDTHSPARLVTSGFLTQLTCDSRDHTRDRRYGGGSGEEKFPCPRQRGTEYCSERQSSDYCNKNIETNSSTHVGSPPRDLAPTEVLLAHTLIIYDYVYNVNIRLCFTPNIRARRTLACRYIFVVCFEPLNNFFIAICLYIRPCSIIIRPLLA